MGFIAIDWIREMLAFPGSGEYEPFILYMEQEDFLLEWYEIDPVTCRRKYTRGVLGRPRGWGKSPLLAAVAILESLGPIIPDGWDAEGQPVGKPWSEIRRPVVQVAAVSEEQTQNTWQPLLEMLRPEAPVHDHYLVNPMETFVALPNRGRIETITSSSRTVKGAPATFVVLDQTEEWVPSNGGPRLANTLRANVAKMGGTSLESPNAYVPGEHSVAEGSASYWSQIREGRARDESLYYSHREAHPDTRLDDRASLIKGLRKSYGDSSGHPGGCVIHDPPCAPGHVDLDRLISTIWDPEQDVQLSRSDFLNQITHSSDSWVTKQQWDAIEDLDLVLEEGDLITMGFDGSRGRSKGKADATALIACRVSDGALFELGVWESEDPNWIPPIMQVSERVRDCLMRYKVVGFFADPSGWTESVAAWEAQYGRKLRVKASQQSPIAAWPRGKDSRVTHYVEELRLAIANGEVKHDGSLALTRHVLHARKRNTRTGYLLYKEFPQSRNKIDSAYAAVLAYRARTKAISKGWTGQKRPSSSMRGKVVIR